ncbi:Enolase-phosphatase E1 [Dermatophagoides farinae]|uniref:Enolase-phosphatase E1 n=1 Tax=Dermatophagoides farinae TaxID=6954 RepID=A0A922L7Y0_DERFA|nr:Enolase-phosphatase E1 [Dermatophagoides farinae]
MVRIRKPVAVICDIEGTTTSVRFWHEVIAPFIKENLAACLQDTWTQPETIDVVLGIRHKTAEDIRNGDKELPPILDENSPRKEMIDSIVKNVCYQMQQRKQSNELKAVHLLVWLYGYQNELLKGHVYPDVQPAFHHWKNDLGIRLFTFATGDTIVQKMLFGCSLMGNLNPYIEDFFNYDSVGKKTDSESFRIISKRIQINCNSMVFLSDNLAELKACQAAGVTPILVIRSHNRDLLDSSIQQSLPYKYIKII